MTFGYGIWYISRTHFWCKIRIWSQNFNISSVSCVIFWFLWDYGVIGLSGMLGRLIRIVRIVGLSDCWNVNLLEMSDRLIRIVGMVGFSDSRTVRFSELLDSLAVGLLELSKLSDYQNCWTINLSEMLDKLIWMETVRYADQNCWNGCILGFSDCQILRIVG